MRQEENSKIEIAPLSDKGTSRATPMLIGMSDGWIIPFVWTAGFAGAGLPATLIGQIGLAITVTAAIAMWLGTYFSAKEEAEDPHDARTWALYTEIGLSQDTQQIILQEMTEDERRWQQKIEQDYELSAAAQVLTGTGWQIALTYVLTGLLTLLPYFLMADTMRAFYWSMGITAAGLLLLSFFRSRLLNVSAGMSLLRYFSLASVASLLAFFIGQLLVR